MSKLYIITGAPGVGKSTISKKIAISSGKSALVEGDEIYSMVCGGYESAWKEGNHLEVFWENCIDIIRNFLNKDYDVVFNYIINPKTLEKLRKEFKRIETKFIVLTTDEKTIISRDKTRPEDSQMKERSVLLLNKMKNLNYDKSNILDTTNLSVEETVKEILNNDRFNLERVKLDNEKYIGQTVEVKIDRQLGSKHPNYNLIYPINYGYIPNTISGDGEEIDCYILGVNEPLEEFRGKCIAIIHRLSEDDDKLIIVEEGKDYSNEQIIALTEFQEKYFESEIFR